MSKNKNCTKTSKRQKKNMKENGRKKTQIFEKL